MNKQPNMKSNKTFTMNVNVLSELMNKAIEFHLTPSELAEKYIKAGLELDKFIELTCRKCGAKYSSKLASCPNGCNKTESG